MSALELPHLIVDKKGCVVSCQDVEKIATRALEDLVNADGVKIGSVRCAPEHKKKILSEFSASDESFGPLKRERDRLGAEMFSKDLDSVLHLSANGACHLDELLHKCVAYLRSYLLVENCSVFGLPDGSTLTGYMAITTEGSKDRSATWNYSSMGLAGVAIREKKPYVCNDPSKDPNFKSADGQEVPKNIVSFPILNEGECIGIVNVSNKSGDIVPDDLLSIQKMANVVSHLLRQEFEKKKSEKFLNTSTNLSRYLSGNVVRKIATTGTSGNLGGVNKKIVALFADIRSFSTISEGLAPAQLVELLNFYFEEMSKVIEKYNGTLDKLVGDLIMVLWNTPNDQPEPELLAVKCALEMQKVIEKVVAPKWREAGVKDFGVGIGINSGDAVVGNLGSKRFMNYTVIGNSINTAQRLESKARSGEIWIHESIAPMVEGKVPQPVRHESDIKLKGLSEPVSAYVLRAPK